MPAKSVKQRRFMGMVRAVQKGEMKAPSPEIASAAKDMSAKAVKEFAKTKEKELPMKKEETVFAGNYQGPLYAPHPDLVREEAPTMNTGSTSRAAGFSGDADASGPTAGMDEPLGGTTKLRGKGAMPKKRKYKCKKRKD